MSKESVIITLVHGTFAKNAPWVQPASEFRKNLEAQINQKVVFEVLNWTGANSNEGRYEASKQLSALLRNQLRKYPKEKKYIISHSHGGNIALYALKNLSGLANEFYLVTMGTPFLNKTIRDYSKNLRILVNIYSVVFGFVAYMLCHIPVAIFILIIEKIFGDINLGWIWLYIFYVMYLIPTLYNFIETKRKKILDELPERIKQSHERFSLETLNFKNRVFITYDSKDEVKAYFKRLISVWESIFFGVDKILKFNSLAAYVLLFAFIFILLSSIALLFLYDKKTSDRWADECIDILVYILPVFFITAFISFFIPLVIWLFKSNPFSLGWESFSQMFFIKTKPDTKPSINLNCEMKVYKIKKRKILSLSHSIYESEIVAKDIGSWINFTI